MIEETDKGDRQMKRETAVKTPYFLVDEERLVKNLELLKEIQEETGCRILLRSTQRLRQSS